MSTHKHHGKDVIGTHKTLLPTFTSFHFRIQHVLEEQHKIFKRFRKATLSNKSVINYVTPRAFREDIG